MIEVVKEPDNLRQYFREIERCCFCRERTLFWYTPNDVACCEKCARHANPDDVPAKKEWLRRERIAEPGW